MKKLLMIGALALMSGCVSKLVNFSVYAPTPIDLSSGAYMVDRSKKVTGTDEASIYLVFPSNMPQYDQAVRLAMAKRKGCVGLADMTIRRETFWFLFGYCDFIAEGYPIVRKPLVKEAK